MLHQGLFFGVKKDQFVCIQLAPNICGTNMWIYHDRCRRQKHYNDVIMTTMASQITSLTVVYSIVYSDQSKHQSSASLAFVRRIHRWPVNSPHKRPVTRKIFPFDDVVMINHSMVGHLSVNNWGSEWYGGHLADDIFKCILMNYN